MASFSATLLSTVSNKETNHTENLDIQSIIEGASNKYCTNDSATSFPIELSHKISRFSPYVSQSLPSDLCEKLEKYIQKETDWSNSAIFTSNGILILSTFNITEQEILQMIELYDNREIAIAKGLNCLQQKFEVYRWHPPLIYGRREVGKNSEGFAVGKGLPYSLFYKALSDPSVSFFSSEKKNYCKNDTTSSFFSLYMFITYKFPIVAPIAIQKLIKFFETYLGTLPSWKSSDCFIKQE